MKKFCFVFLFILSTGIVYPQSTQLWLDYMGYPLENLNWDWEINPGYNKLMSEGGWSDFYINNTLTFQKLQWFLADGSLELHYTVDPEYYNSVEIRPWIMATVRSMTEGGFLNLHRPYIAMMMEYRSLIYEDSGLDEQKFRFRWRIGGRFTLNNDKMLVGTLFVPFRLEFFYDINGSMKERFANKKRFMFGLGYIFTGLFRAELVYYLSSSRNTYENDFEKTDNIFQLLFRHSF